jgi:hypothetical protein
MDRDEGSAGRATAVRTRDAKVSAPRQMTTPRAAGVAGIVFALLFTASVLTARTSLTLTPGGRATGLAGTVGLSGWIVVAYLIPFAGIAFLWFIGVVRDRVGILEDRFFATVFLGSGVLFVAMLFASAAVLAALFALESPNAATMDLGKAIARSMFYMYAARSAGVFTIVTSTILLRTRALARWAGILGIVIGFVLLLSIQAFEIIILLFPAWVALLSVLTLAGARAEEAAAV